MGRDKMTQYNFPTNLRKIRKEKKLSQKELADGIGVSQITISAWERSDRYPTIDKIYDAARFLHTSVDKLI